MELDRTQALIIGGDSLIGRSLIDNCLLRHVPYIYTTRRPYVGLKNCVTLDLNKPLLPECNPEQAFFCAGVTSFRACKERPVETRKINVDAILELALQLHSRGTHIIYLSSNAVFNGTQTKPLKDTPTSADTEYGLQKAEAENKLLALGNHVSVVRMTKVVSCKVSPVKEWLTALQSGSEVYPFSNMNICPISLEFAVTGIASIAQNRTAGITHLSGAQGMSYSTFAANLANALGTPTKLVKTTVNMHQDAEVDRNPRYACLGMDLPSRTFPVQPQVLKSVLEDLQNEIKNDHELVKRGIVMRKYYSTGKL